MDRRVILYFMDDSSVFFVGLALGAQPERPIE
jgi:hypothetical protein